MVFSKNFIACTVSLVVVLYSTCSYCMKERDIFEAAWTGDIARLQKLIGAKFDVHQQDKLGQNPIAQTRAIKQFPIRVCPGCSTLVPQRSHNEDSISSGLTSWHPTRPWIVSLGHFNLSPGSDNSAMVLTPSGSNLGA